MKRQKDTRSPEFLAYLKATSAKLKAVKRLQLKGADSFGHKHQLLFIAPKTLTLRSTDSSGKDVFYYRTDGRASLSRLHGKRPQRGKPGEIPPMVFETPRLVSVLLGLDTLAKYGIPLGDDFERTYDVIKRIENKRPVLRLSYQGADSIGRSQSGVLTIDVKTGLPVGFTEEQAGNSPRDSGDYSNWESWDIITIR